MSFYSPPNPKAHHPGSDSIAMTLSPSSKDPIARIPLDLRQHKTRIALQASITLFTSGILPLIGYLALHYTTTLKSTYILTIFIPIFGLVSLYSLILRTVRLAKKSSTCRPLGSTSAWTLDYFDWNFLLSFSILSVVIAVGLSLDPVNIRMASLPLSLLLLLVCGQLVIFIPLRALGVRAPIRFSSVARGERLRPAVYTIAEDIVAVDGEQGDVFRAQWDARYESSAPFRTLLARLDWVFGVSGVLVAAVIIGVIFGVKEDSVGWAVGWSAPWIWASAMMLITIEMTKSTCRRENETTSQVGP